MARTIIAESTIDHGSYASACPCGCGNRGTTHRVERARIEDIELRDGSVFRAVTTHQSYDGGHSWHDARQCPDTNNAYAGIVERFGLGASS